MKKCLFVTLAVALLLGVVSAAPKAERVQALPDCGPLPSAWYSGYLPVSDTKALHYVYVESLGNVTSDPVLIWLNGGPGCSSLLGAFSENGPFIFDDGQNVIKPNQYSWNARANMLYIESPAHIGFSIGGPNDWNFNDMSQSIDLFAALQQFYVKFPERLSNPLWISGESYAGIYGPYLAW
jgi:carboxypeptidase C (cathepsin A)